MERPQNRHDGSQAESLRTGFEALHHKIVVIRLRGLIEQGRSSLFVVPSLYVIAGILLALFLGWVDAHYTPQHYTPWLAGTVTGDRSLLSATVTAIIAAASIVFSLAFVALQLASSNYSPRILYSFFRERFQQRAMGIIIGTFTYCLVVLHEIRPPRGQSSDTLISSISVTIAVLLTIISALILLAYIDFIAKSLQVVEIVRRTMDQTLGTVHRVTSPTRWRGLYPTQKVTIPDEPGYQITADAPRWVQQIDLQALAHLMPPNTLVRLDVRAGEFVTSNAALCTLWPVPGHPEAVERRIKYAFYLGRQRTLQQDIAFGIRQITDIAVKALSPSVNAPTTAYEAIVHLTEVLHEVLLSDLPPRYLEAPGRRVILRAHDLSYDDYISRAYEQLRQFGANQTATTVAVMKSLGTLKRAIERADLPDSEAARRISPVLEQTRLILAANKGEGTRPEDRQRILQEAREVGLLRDTSANWEHAR